MADDIDSSQRIERAKQFILEAFDAAREVHALTPGELALIFNDVVRSRQTFSTSIRLPTAAPETWVARDLNRRENAPTFIRRVYSPWIGRGLTRARIKELDPDLYRALSVWLTRHPDDMIAADLPRKSDVLDDLIQDLTAVYPLEILRRLGHAIRAREDRARARLNL